MSPIADLARRARKRRLQAGVFAFGALAQGLVAGGLWLIDLDEMNRLECATLVAASWLLAGVAAVSKTRPGFAAAHALRGIFAAAAVAALPRGFALRDAVLIAPFLAETGIYATTRSAVAISAAAIAFAVCVELPSAIGSAGALVAALTAAESAFLLAGVAGAFILMTYHREAVVGLSRRIDQLEISLVSLEQANLSFQEYAERIEHLSEDKERNRITREIHDTIGYALTNISMLLQAGKAIARKDPDRLVELLDLAREQSHNALQESRNILYKLRRRTDATSKYGLDSINRLSAALRGATGIDVEVNFGNVQGGFGSSVDLAVFRLVQEGITNAIKHGMAKRIRISYWLTGEELLVRIWDDGKGAPLLAEGIGLSGMRERFAAFGGRIEAANVIDGFVLTGHVPASALGIEEGRDDGAD